ncbi:SPX domain-containing protein 2-like [Magnolia sinica]|uniref:SPX domain-containing protein 2-like n=1 Tax=Magnolia sinica TaxID=86752 RepID=UPI0026586774|nr:SPX domain-containing protein 2-like [Magnolia sinica]
MKFGKILRIQIEKTLPGWRDKFLSYNELKKPLKPIDPKGVDEPSSNKRPRLTTDGTEGGEAMTREKDFINLLEAEIDKFNTFFIEQEEYYIIQLKELQNRAAKATDSIEELMGIWKEIVDFHGEMVLLENYSAFNYTGLLKILKKYEKRTGAPIRLPFIQKILQQPFYNTDVLNKLIKECETMLDRLFPANGPAISVSHVEEHQPNPATTEKSSLLKCPKELAEIENMESFYLKSTVSALQVLRKIRSGSSTVSVFSLPPLQSSGLEGSWSNIPLSELVAEDVVV